MTLRSAIGRQPARVRLNNVQVDLLNAYAFGAVKQIAFGRYVTRLHGASGDALPAVGTATGVPQVQGQNAVYFDLFLPDSPKPANGWPRVVGHGGNANKEAA
jgi:hypothetical protein